MTTTNKPAMIRVWDLPTRLFHWLLVGLFVFMIVSGESGDDLIEWHFYGGYLLSGLILFRIVWGLLGTRYARFTSFIFNPVYTLKYSLRMVKGKAEPHYGHNPAGGVMVILLLGLLSVQVASGLVTTDDVLWNGPFYDSVSEEITDLAGQVHHLLQEALIILVVLHVAAIVFHRLKYKDALVPAMFHGNKPAHDKTAGIGAFSWIGLVVAVALATGWVGYLFSLPL
ncbi:MAG: cytochrome b/b6 domain-containing protein [Pontibacterium sp.]